MLPHSFVWGHLLQLRPLQSRLPSDGQVTNVLSQLAEKFSDSDSVYYIDTWPFSPPICCNGPELSKYSFSGSSTTLPAVTALPDADLLSSKRRSRCDFHEWRKVEEESQYL